MVNLSPELARRVKQRAKIEGRSISNLLSQLVAQGLTTPPTEARALSELRALNIDPLPHLQAVLADAASGPAQVGLPATIR